MQQGHWRLDWEKWKENSVAAILRFRFPALWWRGYRGKSAGNKNRTLFTEINTFRHWLWCVHGRLCLFCLLSFSIFLTDARAWLPTVKNHNNLGEFNEAKRLVLLLWYFNTVELNYYYYLDCDCNCNIPSSINCSSWLCLSLFLI